MSGDQASRLSLGGGLVMDALLVDGDEIELTPDPPWRWMVPPMRLKVNALPGHRMKAVVDDDGQPLEGVDVEVTTPDGATLTVRTGPKGAVRIDNLKEDGECQVVVRTAQPPGLDGDVGSGDGAATDDGSVPPPSDENGSSSGDSPTSDDGSPELETTLRLVDGSGAPMANKAVRIVAADGTGTTATSDEDGMVVFEAVEGEVTLLFDSEAATAAEGG